MPGVHVSSNGNEIIVNGSVLRGSVIVNGIDVAGLPLQHHASRSFRVTADGEPLHWNLRPDSRITLSVLPDTRVGSLQVGSDLTVLNGGLHGYESIRAGTDIAVHGRVSATSLIAGSDIKVDGSVHARGGYLRSGTDIKIGRNAAFNDAMARTDITIRGSRMSDIQASSASSCLSADSSDD